jgi:phenylacetate-CoA ligase
LRVPDWVVGRIAEPAWDVYERSLRLRTLRQLQASQWWDRQRLAELRRQRLHAVVAHAAAHSPFYGARFAAAGIDPAAVFEIEDLRSLPLLTKADVREHLDEILATDHRREALVPAKTGGSTGVSLRVYCDQPGIERRAAAALRGDLWSGWRLGQPVAAIWGNPPVAQTWRNRLRAAWKDRFIYLDTMHIDAAAVRRFVDEWHRLRPGLLFGHAHSVYILAEALQGQDHGLRPAGIVTSSMMLLDPERRIIEDVFGVPVTNRYGCEEVSLIACQCEQHGAFHLNHEHCAVEFLRDDDSPCAAGEEGRIVVTEFVNYGMPMLRYEVGDRGVRGTDDCPCGRPMPTMDRLTGRTADFLVALDGSRVAGISLIENTLTHFAGIKQMQIVQDARDHLVLHLVPAAGFDASVEAALTATFRRHLGAEMAIEIVQVPALTQDPSGKYRFSICRIPAP